MKTRLRVLLAMTQLPILGLLLIVLPMALFSQSRLYEMEQGLIAGEITPQAYVDKQRADFERAILGFLLMLPLSLALPLWAMRRVAGRVDRQIAFCEAVVHEGELPELEDSTGPGRFATMERSLVAMSEAIRGRDRAQRGHTRLARAMAMTDDEAEALELTGLALRRFVPDFDAELLLADSSMARLTRALEHGEAPGCSVSTPGKCHAVRRAAAQVFDDAQELDACPKLRARGALSAACLPVSVMGRTVGVLHLTHGAGSPPDRDTVDQLTFLADQLGTRLGMLRALSTTQLQADTDPLTGLLNRRSFEERAQRYLSREACVLVMADLDHFKRLNDTHGHASGDLALRSFARLARELLAPKGLVCRFGGEEFVFLLPGDERQARERLELLRAEMPAAIERSGAPVFTASFGLAASGPGAELFSLLEQADEALYRAKEAGRDRIEGRLAA